MPTCIYCLRTDPPRGFNKEHVIPEALGGFHGALTLHDSEVCWDCNQYLGDTVDRLLSRDSAEALLRYGHGVKKAGDLRGMFGERVRARLPRDGTSKWGGAYFDLVTPPPGEQEPFLQLAPQLACERRDGTGWEYFTEDDLRDRPDAVKKITERDCTPVRAIWADDQLDRERLLALLTEIGMPFKGQREVTEGLPLPHGSRVTTEMLFTFDSVLARAVAKIGFNYLAKMQGADFVLRPDFNAVRQFIRYAVGKAPDFVQPQDTPMLLGKEGKPAPRCHAVTVYWDTERRAILSRLSPFNYLSYLVRLCPHFSGVWREILSGHIYDFATMTVRRLSQTRLTPPAAFPLIQTHRPRKRRPG